MAVDKPIHQIGKRKEAMARVFVRPRAKETGTQVIKARSFEDYFPRETHRLKIMQPLELTSTVGEYDFQFTIKGGGLSGQAGAVRHGISRALVKMNPDFRPVLKKAGFMTRDSRMVERKKYGQSGARKRFQFSKR